MSPTPVEVWGPAFHWLPTEKVTRSTTVASFAGRQWCRLCERTVPSGTADAHAAAHREELRRFRGERRRETAADNAARLRELARLRGEARTVAS